MPNTGFKDTRRQSWMRDLWYLNQLRVKFLQAASQNFMSKQIMNLQSWISGGLSLPLLDSLFSLKRHWSIVYSCGATCPCWLVIKSHWCFYMSKCGSCFLVFAQEWLQQLFYVISVLGRCHDKGVSLWPRLEKACSLRLKLLMGDSLQT